MYLNLVLDFVPETVYRVARHFNKAKTTIPIIYVKVGRHTARSLADRASAQTSTQDFHALLPPWHKKIQIITFKSIFPVSKIISG